MCLSLSVCVSLSENVTLSVIPSYSVCVWVSNCVCGVLIVFCASHAYYLGSLWGSSDAIRTVLLDTEADSILVQNNNEEVTVKLMGDSVFSDQLVLLNFITQSQQRKLSVMIFPDAVHPDNYRRLMRLRYKLCKRLIKN